MCIFKLFSGLRKTVSILMLLAVIQAGLQGGISPVAAQSGQTVSNEVYESNLPPTDVPNAVYGGGKQEQTLPDPLTFLSEKPQKELDAPTGAFAVSGQVTENSIGMPLAGVTVRLLLNGHPTQFKTSTDSQGSYILPGVGPGKYTLTFKHPGYAPENFWLNVSEADVRQDCGLFRNTSFKGRVINELGEALEGAQVKLADQNLPDRSIELSTNIDGWFNVADVPPGRYRLSVFKSVYHQQKTVWVDEDPQELVMVLRENKKLPVPEDQIPVDEDSSVDEEVYSQPPNGGDGNSGQPGDGGGNNNQPGSGDGDSGQPGDGEGNNNPPGSGDGDSGQPGGGEGNNDPLGSGDGDSEQPGGQEVNNDQPNSGDESSGQPGGDVEVNNNLPNSGNEASGQTSEGQEPFKSTSKWSHQFLVPREHDPLTELDQLLRQQATIA